MRAFTRQRPPGLSSMGVGSNWLFVPVCISTHQGVRSVAGGSSYPDGSAGIFGRAPTIRFDAALAGLVLRYTFHCERAEGRILAADLVLRIASDVAPRLDFVHVVELENDDAVRWRLSGYRKCLI